jgi:hypothetical protein
MVLTPKNGEHVIYCRGAVLRVIGKRDWAESGSEAASSAELSHAESLVLERFLRYWLQDNTDGPEYHPRDVEVSYDF